MGSSIILKLLNVTHYYRNKKSKKWYKPFGYGADDIELNNISLHIYQGEALGIIGEPGASKSLIGRILSGEIKPDKGKINSKKPIFFADVEDRKLQHITVSEFVAETLQLFPYKISNHKADQIMQYAGVATHAEETIQTLTKGEYAQLLFTLARTSQADVTIFNQVLTHLKDDFVEKAIALTDEYIKNNQTIIMIDDDVDKIAQTSNYIAWISHGQLRMEGSVNQVIPAFRDHEKDRLSLQTDEEIANFDVDWKKNRTKMPELTYNFKRVERYKHAKPPLAITRFWTLLISFIVAAVFMALLMFNDVGRLQFAQSINQETIQNQKKDPIEEKLAYGIVLEQSVTATGIGHKDEVKLKPYSFLTITGESSKAYRIVIDNKNYKLKKGDVRYFDPAGLFESHDAKELAPYMQKNYINYYEYFNSHLHKKHSKVTDTLVPENNKDNRFVVPIVSQPISMVFNDNNNLTGFVYPIKNEEKLKDKFDIDTKLWIVKSGDGYFMADLTNNKWIYIEL